MSRLLCFSIRHITVQLVDGIFCVVAGVQDCHLHSFHFDDQYNTFHSYGYARAPEGQDFVGDGTAMEDRKGKK
jgi:hypothetical protein